jgi:carboxylesterase type B
MSTVINSHSLRYPPLLGGNSSIAAAYLATDLLFTCANRAAVRGQVQAAPVYLYKFDHALSFGKAVWGNATHCYDETCHAGELPFLFDPMADEHIHLTAQETVLTAAMQSYWANFFYTGNPAQGPFALRLPSPWPEYATDSDRSLRITTPACFVQSGLKRAACDFWDAIGYDHGESLLRALARRISSKKQ